MNADERGCLSVKISAIRAISGKVFAFSGQLPIANCQLLLLISGKVLPFSDCCLLNAECFFWLTANCQLLIAASVVERPFMAA